MCHVDSGAGDAPAVEEREEEVVVAGGAMPVTLHLPAAGRGPGVLLLSDVYGRLPFYRGLAARLAACGFVAALPDLFFRQGELAELTREAAFARHSNLDETRSVCDSEAVATWLGQHDAVDGDRVGLLGFCLGGTIALDLAATGINVVTACFYPFPLEFKNPCAAKAPRPVDLAEKIASPVLCHWGDADYIPMEEIEQFSAAMLSYGHPYTAHVYAGAGHGFLTGLTGPRADSPSAHESWDRTVKFFTDELRSVT